MRRTTVVLVLLSAITLGGCADSIFVPEQNGTWEMSTRNDVPISEKERIRWLADYLKLNNLCPNGYEITSRREVTTGNGIFGPVKAISYQGRCKL